MSSLKRFFLILALTFMWAPSFLFIKLAVEELPPFTIVTLRVSIATLILGGILFSLRRALPSEIPFWIHSMILALFSSVMPFVLFCYAEKSIESALAAILNATSPMFTALLAHAFVPTDKLKLHKILGIILSAAGLLLLFSPNIQNGLTGSTLGILAGATAAFCYAISHVYAKKYIVGKAPFIAPTAQLLCSSLLLLPIMLFVDTPWTLEIPSVKAIMGVLGLSLFGTVIAFIIYYKLIEACGPTAISMVACFFPVIGMILGFAFLGETMTWGSFGASTLIVLGVMMVNEVIDLKPLLNRLPIPQ